MQICTNEHILQPDIVCVCFKEVSREDETGLGAHRTALHLHTSNHEQSEHNIYNIIAVNV